MAGVKLMGRDQTMSGLEGMTRHSDFILAVMLAHGRASHRGVTHLMF